MAWGTKQNATQLEDITSTTEQFFNTSITLGVGDRAHVQVRMTFGSGQTDYVFLSIYTTLDASSETWDTDPIETITIPPSAPNKSILVQGFYKFRIGLRSSGATIDAGDMSYRQAVVL